MLDLVKPIRKFLVALIGLAVALGVVDSGTAQSVVGAITALAVYLVPNE